MGKKASARKPAPAGAGLSGNNFRVVASAIAVCVIAFAVQQYAAIPSESPGANQEAPTKTAPIKQEAPTKPSTTARPDKQNPEDAKVPRLIIVTGHPGSSSRALAQILGMHPQATLGKSLNPRTWDNGGHHLLNLTGKVMNFVAMNGLGLDVITGDAFEVHVAYKEFLVQVCEMLTTEFVQHEESEAHTHWILKWAEVRLFLPLFEHLDQCSVLGFDKIPAKLDVRVVHYVRNPTNYRGTIAQFNPRLFDIYWSEETVVQQYKKIEDFLVDNQETAVPVPVSARVRSSSKMLQLAQRGILTPPPPPQLF
jgi:hypothetical protein